MIARTSNESTEYTETKDVDIEIQTIIDLCICDHSVLGEGVSSAEFDRCHHGWNVVVAERVRLIVRTIPGILRRV